MVKIYSCSGYQYHSFNLLKRLIYNLFSTRDYTDCSPVAGYYDLVYRDDLCIGAFYYIPSSCKFGYVRSSRRFKYVLYHYRVISL
ncbi:hypothetical protein [Capybara microvirus Cap1_SP_92]|nr:hypothetical protein [Capybara microvirus Cap1_SP_92]